ncbi:MAG: peroxiredoxin-like family protein [Planctomycetota bacterium]
MRLVNDDNTAPLWMTRWLQAAGIYNVLWGALTVLYPNWLFDATGLEPPTYPFIWQCVGMIVGVYGVGYWIAAADPFRHWPITLVGFLGKLFGPIGYASGVAAAALGLDGLPFVAAVPIEFGVTIPTNDLIWWIPFAFILLGALKASSLGSPAQATNIRTAMHDARTSDDRSVLEVSEEAPALLVFLRHAGCTFCKEALADLSSKKAEIDASGARLVLVHMSTAESMASVASSYGLSGAILVSDPDRKLYRSFELGRGSWTQLFGLRVWLRGAAATMKGHLVGRLEGDGFQMPGAFLVHRGMIVHAYRHATAADRPDYVGLACAPAVGSGNPSESAAAGRVGPSIA